MGAHSTDNMVNKRNRMASAALSRFDNITKQASTTTTTTNIEAKEDDDLLSWNIETPIEYDEDELRTCITNDNNISLDEKDIQDYIQILKEQSINNWRQLANTNALHILNSILTKNQKNNTHEITKDRIQVWITKAQMESIDEIMIDILNNDINLFIKLRDECNCGTPKDLSLFYYIPFILKNKLNNNGDGSSINEEQIKIWCKRAKYVIEKWDWLDDYVTPV